MMTKKIDDGGPAFPWGSGIVGGMTPRQYYAGQALAGGIDPNSVHGHQLKHWFGDRCGITNEQIIAAKARRIADALIAELAKGASE
jgi:hypothetical protein